MTEIRFDDQLHVEMVECSASDRSVCAAARVSTKGTEAKHDWSRGATDGLIRYLMQNRHGTPFEHNSFVFFIHAPIFVFREFHRHRIGWSYNEESGRYKQLDPLFYVPGEDRPGLMQVDGGKPGRYEYKNATTSEHELVCKTLQHSYTHAYRDYETLLACGFAKEVARMCLPVSIYSSMYATCNARSLMAFLSLRKKLTKREPIVAELQSPPAIEWEGEAFFPSNPMWEINQVADKMEERFKLAMPVTHRAFVDAGFVAP